MMESISDGTKHWCERYIGVKDSENEFTIKNISCNLCNV